MNIIGLKQHLGEKDEDVKNKVGSLNTLTKALILTYKVTNQEKYEKLKADYLDNIIADATKKALKNRSEEEKKQIFMSEELELEIQQKKVEVIKSALKGE